MTSNSILKFFVVRRRQFYILPSNAASWAEALVLLLFLLSVERGSHFKQLWEEEEEENICLYRCWKGNESIESFESSSWKDFDLRKAYQIALNREE